MQNSTFTRMDTVTCKTCCRISSVTPHTRKIRCHGCQGIISVGNEREPVSFGICKWQSQDQDNITTDKKGLRHLCKKFSGNIYPRTSSSSTRCPLRISDPPPRGKRALLCGVSYKNKKFKLRGTTQDVINMEKLLIQRFNFPTNAILILAVFPIEPFTKRSELLAEDLPNQHPTRNNILQAFEWLMKDLQSGDSLVFYFSGHGLRQLDFEQNEIDGFDEAICPLDFDTQGLILDNDINKIIVAPLKQGVILHAIIDACHSGTVLDLPHVYDRKKGMWNGNYPPSSAFKGTSGGQAICFSACEDYQEAADTSAFSQDKIMSGAMTYTFIRAVIDNQQITYGGILDSMHDAIEEANNQPAGCFNSGMLRKFNRKMIQDPLLSSSEVFNVNKVFKL